jgi:uncharacterized phage protein (TIGR01671 family)
MNRELKFRIWNNVDKEWDNPAIVEVFSSDGILRPLYDDGNGGDWRNKYVITQYTGLKDCNGTEMWEGDILDVEYSAGHERDSSGDYSYKSLVVVWKNGGFYLKMPREVWTGLSGQKEYYGDEYEPISSYFIEYAEVVGNIHQNPKLVKYEL